MGMIKVAIAGIGNCASSLIQGITYYRDKGPADATGLMHWDLGGYRPGDIEVVAAFDIDRRKVGKKVNEAIFALPNCTKRFCPDLPQSDVTVSMGRILDGLSDHMRDYEDRYTFVPSDAPEPEHKAVVDLFKKNRRRNPPELHAGRLATRDTILCRMRTRAGIALINNIPVFIASDPQWARRFQEKNIPIIGDDIKSQLGATITHRVLTDLFRKRGVKLERTYQLNTGGNTDFLNMLNRHRLMSKKESKTEAVQSVAAQRLENENIHIGPSDYVPWQKDNKVCFIRMEGRLFGGVPMEIELRLSVEDSPNSAGVTIDAIRCVKLALDRGQGGVLEGPSAYFCKHPPHQFTDDEAFSLTENFISLFPEKDDAQNDCPQQREPLSN